MNTIKNKRVSDKDNQEHILAIADIRYEKTKFRKIVTLVFFIIVALSLVFGLINGSYFYHSDAGNTIYGKYYPEHDNINIGWFDLDFYVDSEGWKEVWYSDSNVWGDTLETHWENIILFLILYAFLFSLPIIVKSILKKQCKITSLNVTDTQVYGSYNSFLFKKSLQMPIEKLDNMTTVAGFMDKFRSGVTLVVCSASGIIKLHFVHNAEEVISAVLGRIEEIKKIEKSSRDVAQSVVTQNNPFVTDKLKDLQQMKEQELITEEEYQQKRQEILSKM